MKKSYHLYLCCGIFLSMLDILDPYTLHSFAHCQKEICIIRRLDFYYIISFVLPFSYQSFKELPKLLDHGQKEGAISAALRSDLQPGDEEKERQGHRTGNLEVQKGVPQR